MGADTSDEARLRGNRAAAPRTDTHLVLDQLTPDGPRRKPRTARPRQPTTSPRRRAPRHPRPPSRSVSDGHWPLHRRRPDADPPRAWPRSSASSHPTGAVERSHPPRPPTAPGVHGTPPAPHEHRRKPPPRPLRPSPYGPAVPPTRSPYRAARIDGAVRLASTWP